MPGRGGFCSRIGAPLGFPVVRISSCVFCSKPPQTLTLPSSLVYQHRPPHLQAMRSRRAPRFLPLLLAFVLALGALHSAQVRQRSAGQRSRTFMRSLLCLLRPLVLPPGVRWTRTTPLRRRRRACRLRRRWEAATRQRLRVQQDFPPRRRPTREARSPKRRSSSRLHRCPKSSCGAWPAPYA